MCCFSLRLYVFCLLVVLVKLSILAKSSARKTPLGKPIHDKEIISKKPKLKSANDFFGLVYCFIVLLCICFVPGPTQYISYSYGTIYSMFNNNNNNAIYIAQIHAQQQMGCRMVGVQTERLSA